MESISFLHLTTSHFTALLFSQLSGHFQISHVSLFNLDSSSHSIMFSHPETFGILSSLLLNSRDIHMSDLLVLAF